jgi:hypothetical protein
MSPLGYFGIDSSGLNLAIDLLILFVVVLYLSLIYWTYADARRRVVDPMMVGFATAASLFPFVGTLVYMILRPPEYIEDVHERELEMQAAEARLQQLDYGLCPHCDYQIERDFIRCPSCLRKLKDRCVSCAKPLDRTWTICPYCETEVAGSTAPRRSRRRDRTEAGAPGPATRSSLEGELSRPEPESLSSREDLPSRRSAGSEEDRSSGLAPEPGSRPRGTGRASRPRPTS